ncbi:MAG: WecB/TagA/CpsF family glycosyltransferase [Proteobacteria bacterium]|nr:WecB/TagA/CpsF family glycosyltransferase [Pseudomonadota bacterium]
MASFSQSSYQRYALTLGRVIAKILKLLLWPAAQLGFGTVLLQQLQDIAQSRLQWIGSTAGNTPGLLSSYRLHQRMALALNDEAEWDSHDQHSRSWRFDIALLLRYSWSMLIGHTVSPTEERWPLLGLWLDNLQHAQIESQLKIWREQAHQRRIAFVNPHCANLASKDPLYRGVLNSADLLLPDGSGVLLASRILKTPLQENTNGTDLFPILCKQWQQAGARLYLLGGRHGVAEEVARRLLKKYPGLHIAGTYHGYSPSKDTPALIKEIKQSKADVLVVAMGAPLQDNWIACNQQATAVPLAIGVGGLFDFISGRIPRAPLWLRELGLEWCWRLLQEPGRMWQRYLIGNFTFLARVFRQKLQAAPKLLPSAYSPRHEVDPRPQALLLTDYTLWQGDDPIGTLLSPLVGHSLLELSMIRLVEQGVKLVHVFADQGYSAIAAQLGKGERWGIEIRYYLSGQQRQTRLRLAALPLPEHVWLVAPGCLPNANLLSTAACQWELAQGIWAGWAYIKSEQLKLAPDQNKLPLPAQTKRFDGISLCNAQELNAALPELLQKAPPYIPEYQEVKHQVWLAPGVICEKNVTLIGPLLIGRNCLIRQGSQIGPNTVIGEGCVLDRQVSIHNSLLKPFSYIAEEMSIGHSLVGNRKLYLVRDKTILHFKAEECLIDEMDERLSRPSLGERLQALITLVWLYWHQKQLDTYRRQNLANRLKKVLHGECHLIGLPVLSQKQNSTYERKSLRLGAIRLSELQAQTLPAQGLSREEQDCITDLYGAAVPQHLSWKKLQHLAQSLKHGSQARFYKSDIISPPNAL